MLVERVEQYLIGSEKELNEDLLKEMKSAFDFAIMRQLMENKKDIGGGLRSSNPGPCARQMAYSFLEFPKTRDYEPRTYLTWLFGDLIELMAVALIRLSGVKLEQTILDSEGQMEGYFDVGNGLLIPGHADGLIPIQEGICEEPLLLEVKSTTDFAFKRDWLKGKVDEKYELQHQVYLETFGLERGLFFVINKNTGHFAEVETVKNPSLIARAKENYTLAGFSTPEELPPRYENGVDCGRKLDRKVT